MDKNTRIILCDLNVALTSNYHDPQKKRGKFAEWITNHENYRGWLVDLLRNEYVIIVTARPETHKARTLRAIEVQTGWQPQEALFANPPGQPAIVKERALTTYLFPTYGRDANYLAIESNPWTREMYARHGVTAINCNRNDDHPWTRIPTPARTQQLW